MSDLFGIAVFTFLLIILCILTVCTVDFVIAHVRFKKAVGEYEHKPSVTFEENGVRVRGDEHDVARMLAGCILSMKNMGYDTEDLGKALFYLTKKDEGAEDATT